MNTSTTKPPGSEPDAPGDRLDSWKQIAAYLGRGVTTVQRWEQDEGLPVRRLPHAKRGSVFAFKRELDAWRDARTQAGDDHRVVAIAVAAGSEPPAPASVRVLSHRWLLGAGGLGIAILILVVLAARQASVATSNEEHGLSAPRPVANDPGRAAFPAISPDGRHAVYVADFGGGVGLYITSVDGGEPRRIPLGDIPLSGFPAWSPRGDLIAFLAREGGENRRAVYVVTPDGRTPRRLTGASGIGLCWTPDGDSVGFVDWAANGEPLSIFAFSLTSGLRTRLTVPPRGSFGDTHCAFSTDGRLAVARYVSRYQADICVIRIGREKDEAFERWTYDSEGINGIAWTPDGRDVVFGTASGLWRVRGHSGESSDPIRIVNGAASYPSFSLATGSVPARLLYSVDLTDVNLWSAKLATDGSMAFEKLAGTDVWEDHPTLSPDGRRIAFTSNRTGEAEIWTANPDGFDARQVTFHSGRVVISPQWSPDGEQLVYTSQVGGNRDIYVTHLDGSKATRLTWEPSQEETPSWSRDGRWIYFRSDRGGKGQIWKVPASGGDAVRVTAGEGSQAFESVDGRMLYFVRNWEVPGLWSVPVTGGEERLVIASVNESAWGVTDKGIVFIDTSELRSPEGPTLKRFDVASRQLSVLARLPANRGDLSPGFAVSRDGRSIIWVRRDRFDSDVMMIDRWR